MNWLERARREIKQNARRPTADNAERNPTAAMAVSHRVLLENSIAAIGSNGSAPTQPINGKEDAREDFEERAAIMEFDGGLRRDEAERDAWRLILNHHRLH